MMLFYFLLPALAYGKISIYLDVTQEPPLADAGGNYTNIITADERKTFQIEDEQLIEHLPHYKEKSRSKVPTPVAVYVGYEQNALHKKFDKWAKVMRTVRPTWEVTQESNCDGAKEPYNNQSISVKTTWDRKYNISVTDALKYQIKIANNYLSFNNAWQKAYNEASVQKFSTTPLYVKLCRVTAIIEYQVSVFGSVAANFGKKWDGHYYWAFDIAHVLEDVDLPSIIFLKENITVEYYKPVTG